MDFQNEREQIRERARRNPDLVELVFTGDNGPVTRKYRGVTLSFKSRDEYQRWMKDEEDRAREEAELEQSPWLMLLEGWGFALGWMLICVCILFATPVCAVRQAFKLWQYRRKQRNEQPELVHETRGTGEQAAEDREVGPQVHRACETHCVVEQRPVNPNGGGDR